MRRVDGRKSCMVVADPDVPTDMTGCIYTQIQANERTNRQPLFFDPVMTK